MGLWGSLRLAFPRPRVDEKASTDDEEGGIDWERGEEDRGGEADGGVVGSAVGGAEENDEGRRCVWWTPMKEALLRLC